MRIRTVKPEFWRSDDIDALELVDRLLFIGLWNYVDDEGRGVDRPASIAADLFAGDLERDPEGTSVRVHGGLKRLHAAGLIDRYEVGGRRYLVVVNFLKHQRINRPTESRLPAPTSGNPIPPDPSVRPHGDVSEGSPLGTGEQGKGNRGAGTDLLTADAASARDLGDRSPLDGLGGPAPITAELVLIHGPDPEPEPARDPVRPLGFEAFWDACPRKIGKGKARSEYERAVRRGIPPERLRQRMEMFARTHALARTEQKYIPYPATWLHQSRWEDDHVAPDPAAENRGLGPGDSARRVADVMDAVDRVEQRRREAR